MKAKLVVCSIVLLFSGRDAGAAPITNAFGLLTPDTTVTFAEVPLADQTALTTQFSAFGVTFDNLYISNTFIISAPIAQNAQSSVGCLPAGCSPFDVFFTSDVNAAAFYTITNPGTTTFQAYLNAVLVESFTASTTIPNLVYYGFENILFDQIHVIPGGFNAAAGIDNIEFDVAPTEVPIPEPASMLLLGTGLVGAGVRRWRQRRA